MIAALVTVAMMAPAAPVPRGIVASPWLGQLVYRKTLGARLYQKTVDGTDVVVAAAFIQYRVVADEGDRLRVIQHGKPAWFRKVDVCQPAEAVEHFTKLLVTEPNNTSWSNYRAIALKDLGRYDEAIREFDGHAAKNPQVPTWFNNRATVKVSCRRFDEAIKDLDQAIALNSEE
ncbi:MAG: tetratricopeptide repeat protein, partial [Gemmataceae bacterium]